MQSIWKNILKSIFDEFVAGLDDNIKCSESSGLVDLWDLRIREQKVHDMFADATASPIEFIDGKIGTMQMKMKWFDGRIEIAASNVVLNLNFTPLKALKAAILPDSTPEGFAHRVPADLRRADHWSAVLSGRPSPPQAHPRFCYLHRRKTDRKIGEVRSGQCVRCKVRLQTNYDECQLCAVCSVRENCCLICGKETSGDPIEPQRLTDGFVYTVAEMRQPEYFQAMLNGTQAPYQVPPRYCRFHLRPERRKIGAVRMCKCGHCQARLQTNFEDCALCTQCSDKECRCLLCGAYIQPDGSNPCVENRPAMQSAVSAAESADRPTRAALALRARERLDVMNQRQGPPPKPFAAGGKEQSPVSPSREVARSSSPAASPLRKSVGIQVGGEDSIEFLGTPRREDSSAGASDGPDIPGEVAAPKAQKTPKRNSVTEVRSSKGQHQWQHHHDSDDDDHFHCPPPPEEPTTPPHSKQKEEKNKENKDNVSPDRKREPKHDKVHSLSDLKDKTQKDRGDDKEHDTGHDGEKGRHKNPLSSFGHSIASHMHLPHFHRHGDTAKGHSAAEHTAHGATAEAHTPPGSERGAQQDTLSPDPDALPLNFKGKMSSPSR